MDRSSHCSYVLQQLYNQREWGFLCDCCIAIDDIYFQAHKAVLAACSSYFKMMFINHQNTVSQINLSSVKISAQCFDLILQFMYLGKILHRPEDFDQLKQAMSYLQLYVIPECLEDIQHVNSSNLNCSSTASSSVSCKMVFGVRMYEESASKDVEEPNRWMSDPALSLNVQQEKKADVGLKPLFRKQMSEVIKKVTPPKALNTRERGSRRFGRSFTCDSCGFVFSCEKLLDEHTLTCTNRHTYQSKEADGSEQTEQGSPNPKQSPLEEGRCKVDSSQSNEDSLSSGSTKHFLADLEQMKNTVVETTNKNPVIIKIESDDCSLVVMDDINIVKISDKDYFDPSDVDDLEDEAETLSNYCVDEQYSKAGKHGHSRNTQPKDRNCRKGIRFMNSREDAPVEDGHETACELCGLTVTDDDLSSHYLSKHIENICACGKCGQILVKGRQLQEHAQRCGEPQELMESSSRNSEGRILYDEAMEEPSAVGDMLGDIWDDMNDSALIKNNSPKKQMYKHSTCPYRCPNCGQRFENENQVVEHMSQCLEHEGYRHSVSDENERDHRRKHFCDICGKGFYQRCHLREHYTVHTKEKQFVCQTCGKQFLRERQLRLHNDMHTGMARYVCSLCDQGNFRKHDHVRHMISHLAAGETICQVCFQIFSSNELLEQHMDIHLYTCGVCGAKFNLRKDMRSHYNSKHFKKA
ncbi:zinc finger and BTB domain-containing protein 1 [Xenopus laevis]|uniref:Zinc finger and BTB domain-containing protein 1 n=2 Tax=Xenopus laevis TaxID=8355 RepID=A0A1L8FAA6_XENLA|nr:zinc finger and BTB domain-containing protein 1 [Xenopus laevis]XP_041429031.1 zinc finger and BTB domain-containing protein 1 [Xenopus laevis]OCT68468.1 hypothetical protein XELAEV_18039769mg [Xenopus laevis]